MYPAEPEVLSLVLAAAAYYDIRERRVPNKLIIVGFFTLFGIRMVFNISGLGDFMVGIAYPLALFLILFIFGMLGAGDIKLYCLVSAVTGWGEFNKVLVISLFLGAVFALFKMLFRKNLVIRMQYLATYFKGLFLTRTISPYYVKEEGDGNAMSFSCFIFLGFLVYWRCVIGKIDFGIM